MTFDLDIIKSYYNNLPNKIKTARELLDRPLTLTEKILYAHLDSIDTAYKSGLDYANFYPDRVAMQDATAQMALLQFIIANKDKVAVPSTVHCDHLIQAQIGAKQDLLNAKNINAEVYDFLKDNDLLKQ